MYRVAAYSNKGTRKSNNQDSCVAEVASTPRGDVALVSVCDGVGGLSSGEMASASVVRWLVSWFEHFFSHRLLNGDGADTDVLFDQVQVEWEQGLEILNEKIRSHGRRTGSSLGSTCTVLLLYQGRYLIGHVGDCRVYRFAHGEMEQLTDDQTWVAREVARGNITAAQARSHPKKNVILQSVGTQSVLQPVFSRGDAAQGDVYMVCCDGFRTELFDDELVGAFGTLTADSTESDMYATCEGLAQLVMGRGERDNVTAVACQLVGGDDYGAPIVNVPSFLANPTSREAEEPVAATTYLGDVDEEVGQDG